MHDTYTHVLVCATLPKAVQCSELSKGHGGLFLLLVIAMWECGLSVARFLVAQEKFQIFLKCKLLRLLNIGSFNNNNNDMLG